MQVCVLGMLGTSLVIYRPTEFTSIAATCIFFGLLFAATFFLGTGVAEKLTERKIFLAIESFALVLVIGDVLSKTGNLFLALALGLAVWWGLMLAFLAHPLVGDFKEEKELFRSLPFEKGRWLSRLHKFAFAFFYAPIFVKKDFYFWGFMALVALYLFGKIFR
jgi:hypothetical protein